MTKINRNFNRLCERTSFWNALTRHLQSFADLLSPPKSLTPEDRKILYKIHKVLYECYGEAKKQTDYHVEHFMKMLEEPK